MRPADILEQGMDLNICAALIHKQFGRERLGEQAPYLWAQGQSTPLFQRVGCETQDSCILLDRNTVGTEMTLALSPGVSNLEFERFNSVIVEETQTHILYSQCITLKILPSAALDHNPNAESPTSEDESRLYHVHRQVWNLGNLRWRRHQKLLDLSGEGFWVIDKETRYRTWQ
jgi:hypothetical protein